MSDQLEQYRGMWLQHGKHNDRVYIMDVHLDAVDDLMEYAEDLAERYQYSKNIAKAPVTVEEFFSARGFTVEARIPYFYQGHTEAVFAARYLDSRRAIEIKRQHNARVLETAEDRPEELSPEPLPEGYECRALTPDDVGLMADLYRRVFASYPFPIDSEDYLREIMEQDVHFFGVWLGSHLVAVASAERDVSSSSVEMTDFACRESHRGRGLAAYLLKVMEQSMATRSCQTAFTIARAGSFGMNVVFSKAGYQYGGTLVNNTNISGQLESMNVWHKELSQGPRSEI